MQVHLTEANHDLLYQIEVVQELIGQATVSGELAPYLGQISSLCAKLRQQALRNLKDLSYNLPDTLNDILQATQGLTMAFELVNSRLALPIVRAKPGDRLGLAVLRWLHDSHPKTASLPFGLTDGSFAVYPTPQVPPIYLLPVSRQHTLLYLPLLFHEFGHLLYACHKPEMDDLVREFQTTISDHFAPRVIRDRTAGTYDESYRARLVTAWYPWAQEFYCDAVGLTIGGPCFLKAFSHLFRTRSSDQFYVPRDDQLKRKHPVTWLRLKMLLDRARKYRSNELPDQIDRAWSETAATIGVREDYEGTWADELHVPFQKALDDMLEESQPSRFGPDDLDAADSDADGDDPVRLLNTAWRQFEQGHKSYRSWERQAIDAFLRSR
jgi:hypothetical protein